ncbi:MAG: hypothetical protein Q9169_003013, partial [Polycauliona sp. 2 TL-2023]
TSDDQRNTTLPYTITTQACLDWYYWGGLKDNWTGMICNSLGFFRGTADDYKDSAACYEKCYGCLTESIQAGATNAICRDGHGYGVENLLRGEAEEPDNRGPNCWIGFEPQPPDPVVKAAADAQAAAALPDIEAQVNAAQPDAPQPADEVFAAPQPAVSVPPAAGPP